MSPSERKHQHHDLLVQGTSGVGRRLGMDGAGAATATATNRETRSTLENMSMKHRENVDKIMRTRRENKK
jgi:hypothetical protein